MSGIFKTEIIFNENKLPLLKQQDINIRLPTSVNLVALRESFLSEAPFVKNNNRMFWRRMVDGECFQNLMSASFHIINDCISENSVVDLEKLNNIHKLPLINKMASNLAEMYYIIKLREREKFFARLPEVLAFMVVSALRTSMPKHHRLCQSTRFREILLDWYSELLGGIRNTNCRINREWFFQDIFDVPILTTTSTQMSPTSSTSSLPSSPLKYSNKIDNNNNNNSGNNNNNNNSNNNGNGNRDMTINSNNYNNTGGSANSNNFNSSYNNNNNNTISNGIIRSKYTISLSPLINLYTGESKAKKSEVAVSLSLSHSTIRPLTSLPSDSVISMGRLKGKSIDYDQVKTILKQSKEKRKKILLDHKNGIKEANRDLIKYKIRYKKTLKALEQTTRESVLAMHAGGANVSNNNTIGNTNPTTT